MASFEQTWPTVERQLRRVLRARHVPVCDREDLLQEVAARAIAARVEFDGAADLLPWAATVVRRLHGRHLQRVEHVQAVQQRIARRGPNAPDAASGALARIDLEHLTEAIASWSPFDRDALLRDGDECGASTRKEKVAANVRRHRLRAKLLTVIDGLAGAIPAVRRLQAAHGDRASALMPLAATPAALACAALVLPFAIGSGGGGAPAPAGVHRPPAAVRSPAKTAAATDAATSTGAHAPVSTVTRRPPAGIAAGPRPPAAPDRDIPWSDQHVATDAGEHRVTAEVKDTDRPEPLWCSRGVPNVPDGCVDYPVPVDDIEVPPEV